MRRLVTLFTFLALAPSIGFAATTLQQKIEQERIRQPQV
jgi:hypothetical protein